MQFLLIFPFIFIVGIISIMRWIARGGVSADKSARKKIAGEINTLAQLPENAKKASIYREISQYLLSGTTVAPSPTMLPEAQAQQKPVQQKVPVAATPTPAKQPLSVSDAFKSLENISVLLYLGAFLIVVSAGIFVGFNFAQLSGVFKTVFLALFALAFYGTGLFLHIKTKKLKPAGLTFATIGLILAPLVGLAAYNFIFNQTNGDTVWFVTSLVTFTLYLVSIYVIRNTFMAYLLTFTSLSLIESSISMFNFPVYYFTWGMAFASIVFALIGRFTKIFPELKDSFTNSSNFLLPVALFFSFALNANHGTFQLGVNLLLAAVFYFLMQFLVKKPDDQQSYFGVSLILLPFGLLSILNFYHATPITIAWVIIAIGIAYTLFYEVVCRIWKDNRPKLMLFLGGLAIILSSVLISGNAASLSLVFLLSIIVNAYSTIRARQTSNLVIASIALLLVPQVYFPQVLRLNSDWLSFIYLLVGATMVGVRLLVAKWGESQKTTTGFVYIVAFVLALLFSFGGKETTELLVALILVLIFFGLSYLEKAPGFTVVSVLLFYLSTHQIMKIAGFGLDAQVFQLTLTGLILFGAGFLFDEKRNQILRFAGLIGSYLGALTNAGSTEKIEPIISLFFAGLISYIEATVRKTDSGKYLSAAVLVVAFQWLLKFSDITETQVYMVIWSAYFGVIAYLRQLKNDLQNRDFLTGVALGFLTIPLFFQSTAPDGQGYALILFVESLALVFAGIGMRYKLVINWGIAALVADVIYQLREVLFKLPQWVITGSVGLAILVTAVVLLSRRKE